MLQTSLVEQLYTGIAEGLSLEALTQMMRETALRLVTSGQASVEEMRELLLALPGKVLDSDRATVARLIIPALDALNRQMRPEPNLPVAPAPAVLPADMPPATPPPARDPVPSAVSAVPADAEEDPVGPLLQAVLGLGVITEREERVAFSLMLERSRHDPLAMHAIRRLIDACVPYPD